jgi:tetratricopeptide (TPR) repeat protein
MSAVHWRRFAAAAGIAGALAALFAAYGPALNGGFLWDDDAWTSRLAAHGLMSGGAGLRTLWTSLTAAQQYYPLTATSFWLDYQLWYPWTTPYHLENLLLHAAAAGLFWRLLRRLEVPGAGLAAAIFALHPLMAQSVAWITERKNTLSLVLYLGALLAYGRFDGGWGRSRAGGQGAEGSRGDAERAAGGKSRRKAAAAPAEATEADARSWGYYALALIVFAGALLAKTTTFSLPAVVLLIRWWRHGRIRLVEDVGPTLPFFALAGALGRITAYVEKTYVLAQGREWALTWPQRIVVAGRAFWFYLGKLVWPEGLSFVYPRWTVNAADAVAWLGPMAALLLLAGLWLGRGRLGRGPAVAALFFAGTILPVLGVFNGYFMRFSFVWDHLAYLPSLGPIALAAAGLSEAGRRLRAPALAAVCGVVVLAALAVLTWRQSAHYTDMDALWEAALADDPGSPLANKNYADGLLERGRRKEAIAHYRRAIETWPGFAEAQYNLGNELFHDGQAAEAIAHLRVAAESQPAYGPIYNNLGSVLLALGRVDEAIAEYRHALAIEPRYALAEDNLGQALLKQGNRAEARAHFLNAIHLQPGFAEAHYHLGKMLREERKTAEAIAQFEASLQAQPQAPRTEDELGLALSEAGRMAEALDHFQRAVRLDPGSPLAQNNLGNALSSARRFDEAILRYREALRLQPDFPAARHNLELALKLAGGDRDPANSSHPP